MADTTFGQLRQDAMVVATGEVLATVIESKATKNSKANNMITAKFKIASGPFAGRTITNNFNITLDSPNAMKMFFTHMNTLGFDGAYFDKLPNTDQGVAKLAADMVGRSVTLILKEGEWKGVKREEIDGILPANHATGGNVPAALPTALPTALPSNPVQTSPQPVSGSVQVNLPGPVAGSPENVPAATGTEPDVVGSEEPKLPF